MTAEEKFLYFGYGSNMPKARIKERCPSAKFIDVGKLKDWRLVWNNKSSGKSKKYGPEAECESAKCNIEPYSNETVYGAVYEIKLAEIDELRVAEGFKEGRKEAKNTYNEENINVIMDGKPVRVKTYIGNKPAEEGLKPFDWYREHVLRGAEEHKLPENYIKTYIKEVSTKEDPCEKRKRAELAIYK